MTLIRQIGLTLRNKGLKLTDQILEPKKWILFWWEKIKQVKIHIPTSKEWKQLDKKYLKK